MDNTQEEDIQQRSDLVGVPQLPEGTPPNETPVFEGLSDEAIAVTRTIKPEEFDLRDGINTETEAAAAITGDLVVDSVVADPQEQSVASIFSNLPTMGEVYSPLSTQETPEQTGLAGVHADTKDDGAKVTVPSITPKLSAIGSDSGDITVSRAHDTDLSPGEDTFSERLPQDDENIPQGDSHEYELAAPEMPDTTEASEEEQRIENAEAEYKRALAQIPKSLEDALWGSASPDKYGNWPPRFDARKIIRLLPTLRALELKEDHGRYSEKDKKLVRDLLSMAHCEETSSYSEDKEVEEQKQEEFLLFVESVEQQGFSPKRLIELARTGENMQGLVDLYKQDPSALQDKNSALGMILRITGLPLFDLASGDQESDYYANAQGKESDVRDSVIATIIDAEDRVRELKEDPEAGPPGVQEIYEERLQELSLYIVGLEEKLPELEELSFPIDMIGKIVLDRFNPSVSVNNPHTDYELKIIDRCLAIGNDFRELEDIDPVFAKIVIFGEDDPQEITKLADTIREMKTADPEAYALFETMKKMRIDRKGMQSVEAVQQYLRICKNLADSPYLYELVKDEEVKEPRPGVIYSPPNLSIIMGSLSLQPYAEKERVDRFFDNCRSLSEFMSDERVETDRLLHVADTLEPEKMETFMGIMSDERVQSALDDPELAPRLNLAMDAISRTLNLELVVRSLDFMRSLDPEVKDYYLDDLGTIIQSAGDLDQTVLFNVLQKATKNKDKDGFPYDSSRSVMDAVKFITRESKKHDDPEAEKQRLLDWFEVSGLPYAALPVVVSMSEVAIEEGVANDPMAIYEWIYEDPDRLAKVSEENLRDYIKNGMLTRKYAILRKLDVEDGDLDEVIETARSEVSERQSSFRVLINIREMALLSASRNSGDIDSLFDSVEMTDRGLRYNLIRSGVEIALGIRALDSTDEHRVYGSCGFIDDGVPEGAIGYGDIVLVFNPKSEAIKGTTFTPEDSFHGARRLTADDAMVVRHLKDEQGLNHSNTTDYVEAQIPGDVTLYDAEQIVASTEEQAEQLRSQLPPELAIKVVTR